MLLCLIHFFLDLVARFTGDAAFGDFEALLAAFPRVLAGVAVFFDLAGEAALALVAFGVFLGEGAFAAVAAFPLVVLAFFGDGVAAATLSANLLVP